MIRVLHVVECAKGGVPLFVRRIVEGLDGGFRFGIACPRSSELYRQPLAGATIHPVKIPHQINPLRDILAALRVREVVRSGRYDIVHLSSSKAGIIGALLRNRLPAETIFTPHALRSHAYSRGSLMRKAALLVERTICRSVETVVAVSPEEEQQIIGDGMAPPEKVRLIENGVGLDELGAKPVVSRDSIGVPADAFVVGMIGRLSAQKDPLTFVQAAGLLARQIPEAHFVMVGDGPLEQDIRRRVARTGMSERFHLLGWRTDALAILKLFDVFVLTSRYEGMPFTLLEAAAARKALVSTAAPGVASLITPGKNGLLVDVGDWHSLARCVSYLHQDEDMRSMLAGRAFESIAKPRRLEVMLGQWETLYQAVIEKHESPAL